LTGVAGILVTVMPGMTSCPEEVITGTYFAGVTDSKGKTVKSKSFKVLKDKSTVLVYNGSSLVVSATGVDDY
jgi:hypothetical protein